MKIQSSISVALFLSFVAPFVGAQQKPDSAPATEQRPTGDSWTEPPPANAPSATVPNSTGSTATPAPRPQQPAPQASPRPQQPAPQAQPQKFAPPESVQQTSVAPSSGQWVYTQQYGWVWLPYARDYTYVGSEGYPYSYVYYPTYGWCWLYSPWVFGWGPTPYFGVYGRVHFGWYTHPYYGYRGWHGGPVYRSGYGGWHGGYHGGYRGGFRGYGGFHGGGRRR